VIGARPAKQISARSGDGWRRKVGMRALEWTDAALRYETCTVQRCRPLPIRICRISGI
jgi:hypothetical protein